METKILNYRIVVEPDEYTGTNEPCFTAYCSTLGVSDGGDTIDEALKNIQGAIEAYVEFLQEEGKPIPVDKVHQQIVTSTSVKLKGSVRFAM